MSAQEYESLLPHVRDNGPEGDIATPIDTKETTSAFYFCIPNSWIASKKTTMNNTPFATIILLLNNMIGSGILIQAFIFKETGIIVVICEYLVVALMTYTGVDLMIRSADHVQIFEYSELANKALGSTGAVIVDTSIAIGMFGAIMSYIIIIGSLCEDVLLTYIAPAWYTTPTMSSIFLVTAFVLPMCCIRHFGHLAIVSYASVITIGITMLAVMIVGSLSYVYNENDKLNYGSGSGGLEMMGTVVFAFNYSSAVFHAYEGLKKEDRNVQTFSRIASWTTVLGVALSFIFGLVGYLSFRSETHVDILENFSGIAGTIFKVIFVIHLVLYIPGDYVIMRYSGFKVCGQEAATADEYSYFATTLIALGAATFFSSLIQIFYSTSYSLAIVLGFTGGVANSIFGFIIPALIALKILPHDQTSVISALLLLLFGYSVPFLVITSTVLQYSHYTP